jgi:GDP/UDP-N,N'-diacetylbacillosamine 2-epimerase (hydrolysing)
LKVLVASFSRSSNGAISLLRERLEKNDLITNSLEEANYILAVGDRKETFDFVLEQWRNHKKIIHLWAGEISQGTNDEVYRHSITLMSDLQLCTNNEAKKRVKALCKSVDKIPNPVVIGNIMLDNMEVDESILPGGEYDLILYNPCANHIKEDLKEIFSKLETVQNPFIWLKSNDDKGSEFVNQYANSTTQSRPKFLALLKNCKRFITNSSSMYYEAPFFLKPEQIIPIGLRNSKRESGKSNMAIKNASNNCVKAIRKLEEADNKRREAEQIPVGSETPKEVQTGQQG